MKLRIFLVDDHPVVRSGLKALIDSQTDMCVTGEADHGLAAIQAVKTQSPDVMVMDLSMPGMGGAEATREIKLLRPEIRILALTAHEDRGYAELLLAAGASGFMLKRAAADDLVRAIRAVAAGGVYIDPGVAAQVLSVGARSTNVADALTASALSERESDTLRLVAQGLSIKEAAAFLKLGARTVETYKARGMEKLHLKTRADLIRYALQRGWLKNA